MVVGWCWLRGVGCVIGAAVVARRCMHGDKGVVVADWPWWHDVCVGSVVVVVVGCWGVGGGCMMVVTSCW